MRTLVVMALGALMGAPLRAVPPVAPVGPFVGGGPPAAPPGPDVSAATRARIQARIRAYEAAHPFAAAAEPLPVRPWLIFPQAGNLDEDIFLNGFMDLDPSGGARDWMCGSRTYDGHGGEDSDILSFAHMDIGVPVFAALDGTVVDAHDGEWDRQTSWLTDANPNYVTLSHGGGQYSLYLHLRKGSVAVKAGDAVKAGRQLGLTGSSGFSSAPHLHFESQYDGAAYEPFAGPCRSGESHWARQPAVRTDTFVSESVVCDAYMETYSDAVFGWPRGNTFTTGNHRVANWFTVHNLPAGSSWSVRYLRPGGSEYFASPTFPFNNDVYATAHYWMGYDLDLNATGVWKSIITLNGSDLPATPFFVVDDVRDAVNHPPAAVSAAFDPPAPGAEDVVFCRMTSALLNGDPDDDIVSYHYVWSVDGATVRDVTTAARSDAVPRGVSAAGALLKCTVTPSDGRANGGPTTVTAVLGTSVAGDIDGNGAFDRRDIVAGLRLAGGLAAASAGQVQRGGAGAGGLSILEAVRLARRLGGF